MTLFLLILFSFDSIHPTNSGVYETKQECIAVGEQAIDEMFMDYKCIKLVGIDYE